MKMILKQKVFTFCCECLLEKVDNIEKHGNLIGYAINDNVYLCTIFFKDCGHKRVAILNTQQIEKILDKEVVDGSGN